MNDETTITPKNLPTAELSDPTDSRPTESHFLNMSARAWVAFAIVSTFCAMCLASIHWPAIEIQDTLKDAFLVTVAFFFGQASKPKSQQ